MGTYPPPTTPPPPGPPYGNDWKYQRRVLKDQARMQREAFRAQREAYRYQTRGMRRGSIFGPILIVAIGIIFLLIQTGRMESHRFWDWYGHWWPILFVGAGIIMLLEWAFDQYFLSDPTQPRYRRRLGGGIFFLLLLLGIAGAIFGGLRNGGNYFVRHGLNINQDDLDQFLGDKHESDQTITQAFPAGTTLSVNDPRGDVDVSGTSDDNQIHISVHKEVYTRSDSDADTKAERLSPQITTSGNVLVVTVPSLEGGHADLTITTPPAAPTTITANHGDINVSSIRGLVSATANHGDIDISAITGPVSAHVNNEDSSLSVHSVTGALDVQGRGSDLTLSDLSGPVTVNGEFYGSAHLEHIRGLIKFHTSRTDFQVARLDGEMDSSSEASNADFSASQGVGPLTLNTRNRNITLDRIAGDVSVTNSNGSVDLTSAPPLGNVTIENRNGSVNLTLPEHANFAYQFTATNGDIQSDFPQIDVPDGGMQKKTMSGTVGKGGPTLRVSTSEGDLALKKEDIHPLPPTPPPPPPISIHGSDGSSVIVGKEGVNILGSDGAGVIVSKDGARITTSPDGTKVYVARDGTSFTSTADGTKVLVAKDGVRITSSSDGTKIGIGPGGRTLTDTEIENRLHQAEDTMQKAEQGAKKTTTDHDDHDD